jgi:hypothetical protein
MIEGWTFGEEPDLRARCNVSELATEKRAIPTGGLGQSESEVNRGTFAGAVRTEKPDDLSSFHSDAEIVQRPALLAREEGSIALAHAVKFEHWGHGS